MVLVVGPLEISALPSCCRTKCRLNPAIPPVLAYLIVQIFGILVPEESGWAALPKAHAAPAQSNVMRKAEIRKVTHSVDQPAEIRQLGT